MRRSVVSTALTASVVASLAFAPVAGGDRGNGNAGGTPPGHQRLCVDGVDDVMPFSVTVDGEVAEGAIAYPSKRPTGLVVFAHGYGHSSHSWYGHMRWAADELGLVAVAMDYRGTESLPAPGEVGGTRGWQVIEGAADSNAAATAILEQCGRHIDEVTMFGVSMGANAAGLALAAQPVRPDTGAPLYDWWINVEGAANVVETYFSARSLAASGNAFANNAVEDIEREVGGPFEADPAGYLDLAVVTHTDEIAASGVKGVWHIHGLEDGLVPYDQTLELYSLLAAQGVPQQLYTAVRRSEERAEEDMTNLSGYAVGAIDGGYDSPFVGHGSERSAENDIMFFSLQRLAELVDGDGLDTCRTGTYDAGERTSTDVPCA